MPLFRRRLVAPSAAYHLFEGGWALLSALGEVLGGPPLGALADRTSIRIGLLAPRRPDPGGAGPGRAAVGAYQRIPRVTQ